MSAAVVERLSAPIQLGFLDAPAEPPHLRVAVIGMLARQPEVRISGDRRVHLFVEVLQPKSDLAVVGMLHASADERIDLEQRAAGFLAGTAVMLRGIGLVLTTHRGLDVLELRRCDSVSAVAFDQLEQASS